MLDCSEYTGNGFTKITLLEGTFMEINKWQEI